MLKAGGPDDTGASADANGHGAVKTAPYRTLESGIVGRGLDPSGKVDR